MKDSMKSQVAETTHSLFLTSCLYPPDLLRQRIAYRMMDRIVQVVDKKNNDSTINTLLFAGDHIYADASAGILDPSDPKEKFDGPYDRLKESRSWKNLTAKMDNCFHTIDDHEIADNWEPAINPDICDIDGCSAEMMKLGKKKFYEFTQGTAGGKKGITANPILWGSRHVDGMHLFLLDTRTERAARSADNSNTAKIISGKQKKALLKWLDNLHASDLENPSAPPVPKFIMSGSMILPRRIYSVYAAENGTPNLQSDSWDGYPRSREKLLSHIAKKNIKNVIFLSGDEHLPVEATIDLSANGNSTRVYSLHGSPMWAPFEFANTHPSDLMETDTYQFSQQSGTDVEAKVHANFPNVGNGFLHIKLNTKSPAELVLTYVGDRATEEKKLPLCSKS